MTDSCRKGRPLLEIAQGTQTELGSSFGRSYLFEGYAEAASLTYWPGISAYYNQFKRPMIVDFCDILKMLDHMTCCPCARHKQERESFKTT